MLPYTGTHSSLAYAQPGKQHILVTGGAGFIGSHAALRLLLDGHAVTVIDNLSRGNLGAITSLRKHVPDVNGRLRFVNADLGRKEQVERVFATSSPPVDLVIHFAAVAFVGESVAQPLRYYSNVTANTVILLGAMSKFGVSQLIYSSTCAVYGNPAVLPITEETPPEPINPYGRSKLMAEQAVKDFAAATPAFRVAILRACGSLSSRPYSSSRVLCTGYFNVYGADPEGRLGELPRAELRSQGRISTACYDAALGLSGALTIMGTKFPTRDGTCVRDYVNVNDLVDAHVAVMPHVRNPPVLYNVGTGRGVTVREFVDACLRVTGEKIKVVVQEAARPGDYAEVYADTSKIKRELNWTAKYTDVAEGLRQAWTWRQAHKTSY